MLLCIKSSLPSRNHSKKCECPVCTSQITNRSIYNKSKYLLLRSILGAYFHFKRFEKKGGRMWDGENAEMLSKMLELNVEYCRPSGKRR